MPATAIFTTAQAYIDAVQACNDAVVVAIQTPGADIVNLMTSIRPQVNAIFETRRQKQLSPTVLGETHLVHRFAAKYIKAEREGRSIDEGFRQKIQEMAAKTTPKPAQQSRPPVPTHPAANPTSTMSEGHPPLAQAVPKTVKAASSKPTAPAKASSSTPAPSKVGHSSDAAPHNAPPPKTTTRQVLSHISPPLRVPANVTQPSVHANKVVNAVKRLAELRAAAVPIVNEAATPATNAGKGKGREGVEAAATTAKDHKGKARLAAGAAAGKKRKRDNERPSQRADKREYRGSGFYYQIPCDACERLEKACEKKADQRLVRKGGTASCLGCARGGKKCERPDHPEMSEQDLVLVDDQGEVVDGKAFRGDEDVDMEGSEEEREKDAEPPVPLKKKSRTGVVSDDAREQPRQRKKRPTTPKYVEDTESDVAMEADAARPGVKIGPPRHSTSKAQKGKLPPQEAKYRHVSWANGQQRQDAVTVGHEEQVGIAAASRSSRPTAALATLVPAAPRPVPAATNITPATRELPGLHTATQLFNPPVAKLPAQGPSLSAATPNNATYAHTTLGRLSRLPIQVPEAHGIRDPKLGPADASLKGVIEKQKEVDRSVYALLCCHKDMSVFVERIQGERYRNLDVMASQEASNAAAHQAADKRLASLEKALGMMSARVGQLEVENAKHTDRYKLLSKEHERATDRIKELERRHDVLCKCITQLNGEFDGLTDEVDKLTDLPAQMLAAADAVKELDGRLQKVQDHLFPAEALQQPGEPLPDSSATQQTPHPPPDNTAPAVDADSSATGQEEEMAGGTNPMAIDVDQDGSDKALSEDMDQEAGTQEAASMASVLVEVNSLQESALQEAAHEGSALQEHDARKTILQEPSPASPSLQHTGAASLPIITLAVSTPAPLIADPESPAAIDTAILPPTSTPIANEKSCGEVPTVAVEQPTLVKELPPTSLPEATLMPLVERSDLLAPPSRSRSHSLAASTRSRSGSGPRRSPRFNQPGEEEEQVDFES